MQNKMLGLIIAACLTLPICTEANADANTATNDGMHNLLSGLADGTASSRYQARGSSKKTIKDTDISLLINDADSQVSSLANMVSQNQFVKIDTTNKAFLPFTEADLKKFTLRYQAPDAPVEFDGNYFIMATLDMNEKSLLEIAKEAHQTHGLIVLKGLKNNSIAETFEAASVLTKEGATVVFSPSLFKKFGVKYSPSLTYTMIYNNSFLMTHGYTGLSGRMIVMNLSKQPENEDELKDFYRKRKLKAFEYNEVYRKLPLSNQIKFLD